MSVDTIVVEQACAMWHGKEFVRLPQSPAEATMWVDDDDRLRLYHPALSLQNMQTLPRAWDRESFNAICASLVKPTTEIIVTELLGMSMPQSYFGNYPGIVAACFGRTE